ncbi:hypothetical protein [Parageobacillus toebii]|uniref:hypothetical protein n=1 Tax=Parageobacillus toebii TaxID=153151 RepID=UPI0019673065|nr:hypothetical protein [Parageobacillus toebii]QSB47494.1 hypothetical protein JTI59_09635 [Parageobacillus toebii]
MVKCSEKTFFIQQNVIGSVVSSGISNIFVSELVHLLGTMEDYMEKMILSLKQLMASSAFKMTDWKQNGLFSVIKLLLNGKFRSLASTAKKYIEVSKKGGRLLDPIWTDLAENFVTFKRFLHFLCDHDVWKIHNSSSNLRVFTYFM